MQQNQRPGATFLAFWLTSNSLSSFSI